MQPKVQRAEDKENDCSNLVRDYAPGRQVIDERGSCKATPSPGIEPGSPKDRDFESRAVPLCHEGFIHGASKRRG